MWVVMAALLRVTLAAPEVCPSYNPGDGQAAIDAGADWIVRTQEPSGRYLYEYDRRISSAKPGYNLVRHAGGTMSLYQLAIVQQGSNHQVVEAADRGMNYLLERAVDTSSGGMGPALSPRGPVKTGTAALTLVSLAHRRILTGDERYDGEMRALGRFLVGQQLPDGGMLNFWDPKTGAPVPGERSRFATGEASWGLALLHEAFPGEGWDEPVWAILDYLATERDELEELWPPPWPDQWAAYTLGETAEWGLEDHHLDYAERLAGRFGQMIRWDAQREGVAKITHLPMPRGGGYGTILEGLGALEWLWLNEPRLADAPLRDRLECGAARLAEAQAEDGAWYYDDQTRVDDQQHAISGLLMADVSFNLGGNKP
ncbi:MAG: hypothetical protein OXH23_03470 [bacterium]|nr:hypothetical protein [bacterium]